MGDILIWSITVIENQLETDIPYNYSIDVDGRTVTIKLFLTKFEQLDECKALALQAYKKYKHRRFRVV